MRAGEPDRPHGRFISFEGIDGAGKSTQAGRLAAWLRERGSAVVLTAEPDGTRLGLGLRRVLAELPALDPLAESLVFAAARAEHVRRVIRPALEAGAVVITDRYADSTVAYQGHGRGVDLEALATLHRLAADGLTPDLTIVLDLEVAEGLRRAAGRGAAMVTGDPFEGLATEFHERVRKGYHAIHEQEPRRVVLVAADGAEAEVALAVRAVVASRLRLGEGP